MNTTDPTAIPAAYLDAIRASAPALPLDHLTYIQEGMINDIVIVDDRVVFRFPKTPGEGDTFDRERLLLDLVRDRIGVTVPTFTPLPGGGVRYDLIPGEPLTRDLLDALPPADRHRLLIQLGDVLTALHGMSPAALAAAGIDRPSLSNRTREDWLAFFDRVEAVVFPHLYRYQRDWVLARFAPVRDGSLDLTYDPAFVHGDLAPYHLLVDPTTSRLAGVIDFETAGLGDPAVDVSTLLYSLGDAAVADLVTVQPSLATTLDRARFWTATLELQWAVIGIEQQNLPLLLVHIGS